MFNFEPVEPKSKDDIKAARNYLNWTQPELAVKVGCNTCTISTLESGKHIANKTLIKKIAFIFSKKGIKFSPRGGFLVEQDVVNVYEGNDCYLKLQEDILETCEPMEEILYLGCDDKKSTQEIIENEQKIYNAQISCKYLIAKNNNYIIAPIEDYKTIDKDYFLSSDVIVIYKNKIAFASAINEEGRSEKVIIINDINIAKQYKKYFYRLWNKGKKITKSRTKQIIFYN